MVWGLVLSSAAFGEYSKDCARPNIRCIHAFNTNRGAWVDAM